MEAQNKLRLLFRLMSKAGMSPDNTQQNLFEGDVNVTNTDTFGSVAQVTDAMNDPRYAKTLHTEKK